MKTLHTPTVTVALSAFNEEKNIGNFLDSIKNQREIGFRIKKILLVSDGSTDKTVTIAQAKKIRSLHIMNYKKRIGKSSRLNALYKILDTDYLVQTDADVIFSHQNVIRDILRPLIKNKNIQMCGGNPLPLKAQTMIEAAINHTTRPFSDFRQTIRKGHNVFSADGRLLAFRREFIQEVQIPTTMIANDMYAYFCCKNQGGQYRFVPSAIVHYRSPQTLEDHVKQNTRFNAGPLRMVRYFDEPLVKSELYIPLMTRMYYYLYYFLKNPLLSLYIMPINIYCRIKALIIEQHLVATWNMAITTKGLVKI